VSNHNENNWISRKVIKAITKIIYMLVDELTKKVKSYIVNLMNEIKEQEE